MIITFFLNLLVYNFIFQKAVKAWIIAKCIDLIYLSLYLENYKSLYNYGLLEICQFLDNYIPFSIPMDQWKCIDNNWANISLSLYTWITGHVSIPGQLYISIPKNDWTCINSLPMDHWTCINTWTNICISLSLPMDHWTMDMDQYLDKYISYWTCINIWTNIYLCL